jgi:hypothetical protein
MAKKPPTARTGLVALLVLNTELLTGTSPTNGPEQPVTLPTVDWYVTSVAAE